MKTLDEAGPDVHLDVALLKERLGVVETHQAMLETSQRKLETQMMNVRLEVHELNENVSRSNKINIETQVEVQRLRRETQDGFSGVRDSLIEIYNKLTSSRTETDE